MASILNLNLKCLFHTIVYLFMIIYAHMFTYSKWYQSINLPITITVLYIVLRITNDYEICKP